MKIRILIGALIIIFGFTTTVFAIALQHLNPHFQGIVMENSGAFLIVSEKKVLIKDGTRVMNSKKEHIKLSDIKAGSHVYVKGEFDENEDVVAEKIYLLPGHVTKGELDKYPFMKGKEE